MIFVWGRPVYGSNGTKKFHIAWDGPGFYRQSLCGLISPIYREMKIVGPKVIITQGVASVGVCINCWKLVPMCNHLLNHRDDFDDSIRAVDIRVILRDRYEEARIRNR